MLFHQKIRMIEDHWERITFRAAARIREDPDLPKIRKLTDSELQEWGRLILKNLGQWLVLTRDERLARRYESLGRLRLKESVPLHEVVHGVHLLKDETIEFARSQGFCETVV